MLYNYYFFVCMFGCLPLLFCLFLVYICVIDIYQHVECVEIFCVYQTLKIPIKRVLKKKKSCKNEDGRGFWQFILRVQHLATNQQQPKLINFLMCHRVIRCFNKRHAGRSEKAYSTWYSKAVSHPTSQARRCRHVQGGMAVSNSHCDKYVSYRCWNHMIPLFYQIIGLRD